MKALLGCAISTLRHILAQRGTIGVLLLGAIFYSLFYPSPYVRQVLRDVPVVVIDRDRTPLSRQVSRWLDASEGVRVLGRWDDLEAGRAAVRAGDAGGVVLIPEDFERHLLRHEPAFLTAYTDGSYLLIYSTVSRAVNAVAGTIGATVARQRAPVSVANWPLFNPIAGYGTFLVPAVFIILLQQTLLIGMGALRVAERKAGVSAPIWADLGGKAITLVLLYLIHAAFMFTVSFRLYHLPFRGDPLTVTLFLIPFLLSTIFLGIAIAEAFQRTDSPIVFYALTALPAVMVSGISFPAEDQAGWVRILAMGLPSTFGIRGFIQVGEMGASASEAMKSWTALWVQAAVYAALAAILMRRRKRIGESR